MDAQLDLITWTRDALERLFDVAFLRHHAHAARVAGQFTDGHALQEVLLATVKQLKPPLNVPASSPAWRIYNVLNLRYVQGLSQSETAVQLGIGLRQLRREQQRALHAMVVMLFDTTGDEGAVSQAAPPATPPNAPAQDPGQEFTQLDELLTSTIRLFEGLIEQQQLRLRVAMPPSMPAVRANRMVLRQLLVSGVGWALHHAQDAAINVEASIERGKIILSIQKPLNTAEALDEPAPNELITARELAALLPAEMSRVDRPDCACLEFSLPTDDALCILMIDDNPHAIQLAQRYLQQSGDYYLVPVSDPREALRRVVAVRPACVLLDVMMPERDGWELLTLFRAHPEISGTPIIVSSVLKEEELARSLGATAVLTKPFTAAQLIATLRSVTGPAAPRAPTPPSR